HYHFAPMAFRPRPVQRPRIPVWVVGAWPHVKPMRRAARWDGLVVQGTDADGQPTNAPANLDEIVTWVTVERMRNGLTGPYDIVVGGTTPADDPAAAAAITASMAAAGATWWTEADWDTATIGSLRARIAAGPPRA
ncbi:MAG: LLM class flavin-dependent oxidoreductase, partial [Chloroflexota bacterium]